MIPAPRSPRAASHAWLRAAVGVALAMLLLLPSTAMAAEEAAPTRLLVTYAAPVEGEVALADAGVVRTASVAGPGASAAAPPGRVHVLELPSQATAASAAHRLAQDAGVVSVEADHAIHLDAADAWGIDNHGQQVNGSQGRRGVDIGVTELDGIADGSGTVVAVIDTGIDVAHPLLRDRIWRNDDEADSGRDDDANGYVDDVAGWNFVDDSPEVSNFGGSDFHGTHVAGVIAAGEHGSTNFRGVAPGARIMPLPFISGDGVGRTSDAIRAIGYAADNGADVINASWGSDQSSNALRTAIVESGVLFVSSAGNSGQSHEAKPMYPGAYGLPNQLTVAAVDHGGDIADFSATSRRTVHVAAPGVSILGPVPGARLATASGTSMAAPFAAGAMALAIQARPDASPQELVAAAMHGARPLPGAQDTVAGGIVRAVSTVTALGGEVPVCRSTPSVGFRDVPPDHVHRRSVACLASLDVTSGISAERYGAELGLTRAQVASLVARTMRGAGELPPAPATSRFTDVDASVHRDAIDALASVGIVQGSDDGTYAPSRTVTRGEFAGIVARAAEHLAGAPARVSGPSFEDIGDTPEQAGIRTASALSLVVGTAPGVFQPDAPVRRDQAATMLVRLLDRLHHQGLLDAA